MTCIVGLCQDNHVYVGGDSAGVANWSITVRADTKVFKNGLFILGFTDSFRMGQLLRYSLISPPITGDIYAYMVTVWIDAVRKCLKDGGYAQKKDECESGGQFLVGIHGKLFKIDSDYQVGESTIPYTAIGCGADLALGAMAVTAHLPPIERLTKALQTAEQHSAGVRGPFSFVTSKE